MKLDNKEIFKTLNPNKIWLPVIIGLGIVFFMFYSDPTVNSQTLSGVFDASTPSILLAVLFVLLRDVGYVYRIRQITGKFLSWEGPSM